MALDPNKVIDDLAEGNKRFLSGKSTQTTESSLKKLKAFGKDGQIPKAIFLCCADSRAPVEMIFDQDVGDLFVIRVAGNIVAPSLVGSVEFAASAFGTRLVVVMGHSQCGAIKATLDNIDGSQEVASENIHDIVSRIKPHIFSISQLKDLEYGERWDKAVQANVMASVGQLSHSSRIIEELVGKEKLKIVGAVLDLDTGKVDFV